MTELFDEEKCYDNNSLSVFRITLNIMNINQNHWKECDNRITATYLVQCLDIPINPYLFELFLRNIFMYSGIG